MEKRTIKTIAHESYPKVGELIRSFPELFNVSDLIGIYKGKDMCSSFLLNSNYLKSISFYENFQFTNDKNIQEDFKKLYKSWENTIPNLTVHLKDGNNFKGGSNFVLIDTTTPLTEFIKNNRKKLRKSLAASPGFGENIPCTLEMSKCILNQKIFPILIYRDYLFYCFHKKRKQTIVDILSQHYRNDPSAYETTYETPYGETTVLTLNDFDFDGYLEDVKQYE